MVIWQTTWWICCNCILHLNSLLKQFTSKMGLHHHFANIVRTFLDEQFPARWIGRGSPYITWPARSSDLSPPLWARRQNARLSRSGPGFDPRSGQVSWVTFFRVFSSRVRQMSGSFRPPRSPNIIWPSLSSSHIIHYGRQWPEMLTRPKTLNIHIAYTSDLTPHDFFPVGFC